MRDAIKPVSRTIPSEHDGRSDGFVLLVIVGAAALVAMFALHGGPNLLGDAFDPSALLAHGQ